MLNTTNLIFAFILGIIEGITEFLPISSTGHLILIDRIAHHYNSDTMLIFTVITQLGAIASVLVIFRKQLRSMMSIKNIRYMFYTQYCINNKLCIRHIFVGTLPGIFVGFLFYEKITLLLLTPINIVYGLISGSILLLISNWYFSITESRSISNINHITYYQAFFIGCFQCLAFWPGFSRFGSTIGGGLLIGLNKKVASEFSFFLAIPIILGSVILTTYLHKFDIDINHITILITGFFSAFIAALITMKYFLKIIQNISLLPFILYRFLLAIIIYFWIVIS